MNWIVCSHHPIEEESKHVPATKWNRPSERTTVKDQTSRDYSFGHLIGVHTVFVPASLWGRDIPCPRYKRALFNVQLEMSGDVCSSELCTSCSETPVPLFSNRCDTYGKSFVHSSSYRRHTRTQCASQSRKRRRKLWISDGVNVDEEEYLGCWILLSVEPKVKFSVIVFYYGNQVTFVGGSKPAKLLWTLVIE